MIETIKERLVDFLVIATGFSFVAYANQVIVNLF
jgi:hypothetical protein